MKSRQLTWTFIASIALALLSLASCNNKAETTAPQPNGADAVPARDVSGAIETSTITSTATVQSIDPVKRTITLTNAQGDTATYKCGPDVINFDQIQVGDRVSATVIEQMAIYVRKPGDASMGAGSMVALAPKGAKPGVVMADTAEITSKITAIDPANHTVTLQNVAGNTKTFRVNPAVDLSKISVGDEVVVQYTQGLAILVQKPQ